MALDTSIVFALSNKKDKDHQRSLDTVLKFPTPYLIPTGILTEIAWLLEQRLGLYALNAFLIQSGVYQLSATKILYRLYLDTMQSAKNADCSVPVKDGIL